MNFGYKANPLSILINENDGIPNSVSFHENV